MPGFQKAFSILLVPLLAMLLVSCGTVNEVIQESSIAMGGGNQMMLVRRDPASFGYVRMGILGQNYPDIRRFVKTKGVPDFFAEANNSSGHYCLFYYLRKRHAFISRICSSRAQTVQFAGPYPITDKELDVLTEFQREHRIDVVTR